MGMQTVEEVVDVGSPETVRATVMDRFKAPEPVAAEIADIVTGESMMTQAEIDEIRRQELETYGTDEERQQSGLFEK